MAINPSIPLQTRAIDPSQGIGQLANAIQFKQQMDFRREQAGKAQETRDKQNQALDLEIDARQREQALNRFADDALTTRSLLASGNVEGAKQFISQRIERLNKLAEMGRPVDSLGTQQFAQLLETDPQMALAQTDQALKTLAQRGIIKRDESGGLFSAKTQTWKNGTAMLIGPTGGIQVIAPNGQVAATPEEREQVLAKAYADENSNLKSDEEVKQILEIAEAKSLFGRNFQQERLELQKLQQDIDAGKAKLEETEENRKKGQQTRQTIVRLTDELLKNPDGVRSFVGPLSQLTPSILPDTLRARTAITQLQSLLTVDNLKLMTGVLSESDIKILAAVAGGGLDVHGDEEAFLNELERLNESAKNEISAQPDQPPARLRFDAQGNRL